MSTTDMRDVVVYDAGRDEGVRAALAILDGMIGACRSHKELVPKEEKAWLPGLVMARDKVAGLINAGATL